MNSSTFSCAVSVVPEHSAGKVRPLVRALLTWKSLKSTRPHWASGAPRRGC
jgi:hypothetical protein